MAIAPRGTQPMHSLLRAVALAAGLCLLAAPVFAGRGRKHIPPDKRTTGLGKNCKHDRECKGKTQRCLKESDANGKEKNEGFCVLPCLAIDAGIAPVVPGQPLEPTEENVKEAKKPPPPRCPPHYQCRSAGSGVPFDLCFKD